MDADEYNEMADKARVRVSPCKRSTLMQANNLTTWRTEADADEAAEVDSKETTEAEEVVHTHVSQSKTNREPFETAKMADEPVNVDEVVRIHESQSETHKALLETPKMADEPVNVVEVAQAHVSQPVTAEMANKTLNVDELVQISVSQSEKHKEPFETAHMAKEPLNVDEVVQTCVPYSETLKEQLENAKLAKETLNVVGVIQTTLSQSETHKEPLETAKMADESVIVDEIVQILVSQFDANKETLGNAVMSNEPVNVDEVTQTYGSQSLTNNGHFETAEMANKTLNADHLVQISVPLSETHKAQLETLKMAKEPLNVDEVVQTCVPHSETHKEPLETAEMAYEPLHEVVQDFGLHFPESSVTLNIDELITQLVLACENNCGSPVLPETTYLLDGPVGFADGIRGQVMHSTLNGDDGLEKGVKDSRVEVGDQWIYDSDEGNLPWMQKKVPIKTRTSGKELNDDRSGKVMTNGTAETGCSDDEDNETAFEPVKEKAKSKRPCSSLSSRRPARNIRHYFDKKIELCDQNGPISDDDDLTSLLFAVPKIVSIPNQSRSPCIANTADVFHFDCDLEEDDQQGLKRKPLSSLRTNLDNDDQQGLKRKPLSSLRTNVNEDDQQGPKRKPLSSLCTNLNEDDQQGLKRKPVSSLRTNLDNDDQQGLKRKPLSKLRTNVNEDDQQGPKRKPLSTLCTNLNEDDQQGLKRKPVSSLRTNLDNDDQQGLKRKPLSKLRTNVNEDDQQGPKRKPLSSLRTMNNSKVCKNDVDDSDNEDEQAESCGLRAQKKNWFYDDKSSESCDEEVIEKENKKRETAYPKVVVYQKKENDKSKNKKLPCFFCDKIIFHLRRHLETTHRTETEIWDAKVNKDRTAIDRIFKYGVFKHNVAVLAEEKGVLYAAKSTVGCPIVEDYLPCQFCFSFFVKRELFRHCAKCKFKTEDKAGPKFPSFASAGRLVLDGALQQGDEIPEAIRLKVLHRMRPDNLTKIVKRDRSILQYGVSLLNKLGPKRANDIAQRMRQLARLSARLQKSTNSSRFLLDTVISGAGFDQLITAIEEECQVFEDDSGRRLFKNPNLALKLGHSLLKLGHLKIGASIRSRLMDAKADAEAFVALHVSEFMDRVSSAAHASVKVMPRTLDEFPDAADLALLKEYQLKASERLIKDIQSKPSQSLWRQLAEVTMSRILVFNARRGMEVTDLKMTEYSKRTNYAQAHVLGGMSSSDRQLVESMRVINIVGKRDRSVPILLTGQMLEAMEVLANCREACDVNSERFFVVPGVNCKLHYYQVLKKVAMAAKMSRPELLTTTRIRKHLATMAQYLEITPTELEWMSAHMGHDVKIHKGSYRLHTPAVEITKVGRVLMSIDSGAVLRNGATTTAKGVVYSDEMDDIEPSSSSSLEASSSDEDQPKSVLVKKTKKRRIDSSPESHTDMLMKKKRVDSSPVSNKTHREHLKTIRAEDISEKGIGPTSDEENTSDEESSKTGQVRKLHSNAPGARQRWTPEELSVLLRIFGDYTKPPTTKECEHVQNICSSMKRRKIAQIKSRAWALTMRAKKTTTKK